MSNTRYGCPLCEFQDTYQAVYRHLQKSHRKSELSREVLENRHTDADWVGAKFCESQSATD